MIICPNCQHKEISGALFCSNCGAQLIEGESTSTQNIERGPTGQLEEEHLAAINIPIPDTLPESRVSLYILESGQIIPLVGREEYTLGRSAQGQPILPDIDLTPFKAYENGVSRLHASIKVGKQIFATDLGSVNGTLLNGKRIPPHQIQTLNHGDVITLGKLKIQVLIRQ